VAAKNNTARRPTPSKKTDDGGIKAFLTKAGAAKFRHAHHRTLVDHLLGTAQILRRWRQPEWIQNAGAVHSVYSTEAYTKQLIPLARRNEVRAVAGEESERLAYLFCVLSREDFWARTKHGVGDSSELITIRHAGRSTSRESLGAIDVYALMILHMANIAEQSRGPGGGPGEWLSTVSGIGAKLDQAYVTLPTAFAFCSATVSVDEERQARDKYQAGLRLADDANAAASAAEAARLCVWPAEPCAACAYRLLACGNVAGAGKWIKEADRRLAELGICWDPRLDFDQWRHLNSLIAEIASGTKNLPPTLPRLDLNDPARFIKALERSISAPPPKRSRASVPSNRMPDRFAGYIESFSEEAPGVGLGFYPGLDTKPWYDARPFALARELTAHFHEIREEFRRISAEEFHPESEDIARTGSWDVFIFYERGRKNVANCGRCPVTAGIIESNETVRTLAGLIYFSRLRPGTHIAAHKGPTNLRLRCHLGIQIPDGDCRLRVGPKIHDWKEGACIVFDDSYEHEAWNHTNEERVVLIVDVWHPDLSDTERVLLRGLHKYANGVANSLIQYWGANKRAAKQYD
jgi:hypothetical protein